MTKNEYSCEYLSCNKTAAVGSIYCFKHEQEQKIKPAQTLEAETQ